MQLPEELVQDVMLFLSKIDELSYSDRKELLANILEKHIILSQADLKLSKYDFDKIVSGAKEAYASSALPKKIGKTAIDHGEAVNLLLIESAVCVLNNKGALKRLPKFEGR